MDYKVLNTNLTGVSDQITALLGITPEERQRLDLIIDTSNTKIAKYAITHGTVLEETADRVVLKIPADPDAAREIADVKASVTDTLGSRADVFLEKFNCYNDFNKRETTLIVTRDEQSGECNMDCETKIEMDPGQFMVMTIRGLPMPKNDLFANKLFQTKQ